MPVAYDLHGEGNAGHAVLLSSGLGGAAGYWKAQVPALLAAGYRVITYDHRGTGRSAEALPRPYAIAQMAADVAEVLDQAGIGRCHFVGHALGGLVGLQLALDAPDRLLSLTLVNAWARLSGHTRRCFQARLALLDACGPRAYVEAQPIFLYPASWCEAHPAAVEAEVEHALAGFAGAEVMHARIGALREFDVSSRLGGIQVPALVLASTDDVLVPWACSRALADGLPRAALDVAEQGGHAFNVTCAEAFDRRLLAFLSTVASGSACANGSA